MSITPAMNITLPEVSVTPGPEWATELNAAFSVVDVHDHSLGNGIQVPTAGLNINADLSLNQYSLANTKSIGFYNNPAILDNSHHNFIYGKGGDLYWNNDAGVAVKVTAGTTVNVSGLGGIGGNYTDPGSTASVIYSFATKSYLFFTDVGKLGNMGFANMSIFEPGVVGAKAITIKSPLSLANNYSLNLFTGLPAVTGKNYAVTLDSNGQLAQNVATTLPSLECVGSETVGGDLAVTGNFKITTHAYDETKNLLSLPTASDTQLNASTNANGLAVRTTDGTPQVVQTYGGGNWAHILPPGSVIDYAGPNPPNGFLLCYGQAISRTGFAGLFAAIGVTYGPGDGSTTFNLPDCRGRGVFGKNNMGGTGLFLLTTAQAGVDGNTLGTRGGVNSKALSIAEMPYHHHSLAPGLTQPDGLHNHGVTINQNGYAAALSADNFLRNGFGTATTYTTSTDGAHTHGLSGDTEDVGGSSGFFTTPTLIVMNKIIRW